MVRDSRRQWRNLSRVEHARLRVNAPGCSRLPSLESTVHTVAREWPAYAGNLRSGRYSPLDRIDREETPGNACRSGVEVSRINASRTASSVEPTRDNESHTGDVAASSTTSKTLSQVAAYDARTGETKWGVFDPKLYENGRASRQRGWMVHRGVAYWRAARRVCDPHGVAHMILLLDCQDGKAGARACRDGLGSTCTGPEAAVSNEENTHELAAGDVPT